MFEPSVTHNDVAYKIELDIPHKPGWAFIKPYSRIAIWGGFRRSKGPRNLEGVDP